MALTIRPADIIKAKVIDFLIKKFDGVVIGDEVKYGSSRKVVDMLALYRGETYAIEIKSAKDDLRRLPEQISEYSKIFDHTMIFTTNEHLIKVRDIVKNSSSVFAVYEEWRIEGQLQEKKNNVLKYEMLATMNSLFIRKRLNITNAKDSDCVRKKAMRYKMCEIHTILYDYFMKKLYASYRLFLNERNEKTEIDDISILSNRLNIG